MNNANDAKHIANVGDKIVFERGDAADFDFSSISTGKNTVIFVSSLGWDDILIENLSKTLVKELAPGTIIIDNSLGLEREENFGGLKFANSIVVDNSIKLGSKETNELFILEVY